MKRKIIISGFLFAMALVLSIGLAAAVPALAVGGTDYYVSTTGSDEGDGSDGNPWGTIQHAIDAVANGDTINVAAGTYNEALDLDSKSLTIEGAGVDITSIDASAFTGYAVKNFGNATTIKNLTLIGTGSDSSSYGFKVSHVSDIIFDSVKVENSYKTAFDLNTVNGAILTNIEAVDTVSGFGLMILDATDVSITNITTIGNAWGGVSVQTKNGPTDTINFSGSFSASEDIPLLLEKDPPTYYDITNVQIPGEFTHVVYAFREGDNYQQTFYRTGQQEAEGFARSLVDSNTFTYSDILIYDIAEENYHVIEGIYIQDAIDAASDGDTINVEEGNYQENITVSKSISLIGALDGSDLTTFITPPGNTPVITLSTSGISATEPVLLENLHISTSDTAPASDDGKMTGIRVAAGTSLFNIKLDNITVIGNNHQYDNGATTFGGLESGFSIAPDASLSGLEIANCYFKDLSYGFVSGAITAANPGFLTDVNINNTTFEHNSVKGIYIERLSDAVFTNLTVIDNGIPDLSPSWADQYNSGIDINLKYGSYHNIVLNNLTVTGNGIGSTNGTGLTVKARGTGNDPSYSANPASLDGVTVDGGTFTGNTVGIRFGEPGKDNTGPTNVAVNKATITGNSQSDLTNLISGVTVDATDNWWNSANGPQHTENKYNIGSQGSVVNGTVTYAPWLKTAGGVSFAPVMNGSNGYASIQAAIDAATSGDELKVAAGTFTEAITINKSLTLCGATYNVNKNGYSVPADYAWNDTVESIIVHPTPTVAYNAIVDIVDVDSVTFEGFIVQELNAVDNLNTSLIRVYAKTRQIGNIIVRNNIIGPNTNTTDQDGTEGRMGLYIVNHPYSNLYGVVNSTFSGNKIFDCKGNGDNVFIWSSYQNPDYGAAGSASMAGTVIEGNEIYGAHRSGIETSGGYTGLTIQNNKIYNNGGATITGKPDLMFGNGIVLIRGSSDSHSTSIPGFGPENLTINNNEIYGNQRNGIYIGPISKSFAITNNKIYNNGWDGMRLDLIESYNNPDFEAGNRVPWPDQTQNIAAHFNRIYNNTLLGIQIVGDPTNGFVFDATDNWWGTANAADVTAKVSANVDYDPWHLKSPSAPATDQVTATSVVLRWTTEGTWDGDYYDFRYATAPIATAADWNNAKRMTGEPTPQNATQEMIIRGLTSGTKYYFGFTMADESNSSDIGQTDVTTLTVAPVDNTPPDAVTDLAASAGSPATTSVVLNWTATGDDGATGFAAKYIIKRSTNPITADTFDAATTVYNSLTPKASGQAESLTITKLSPDTLYYFAIKAQDEKPNTSDISNVVSILTANILPTVTGIAPTTGDNGETRTLTFTGANYAGAGTTVVRLVSGDNVLTLTSVSVTNDTQLTAVVPKGVPTGTYQARITNNNGTSSLSTVTYVITAAPVPLPVVTNVIPNMAASNTDVNGVEIFGQNFTGATAVAINGQATAIVTVNSATKITVNVPGLAAGEYDIKVTTTSGTNDVSAVKFVVTDPVVIDTTTTEDTTTSTVVETTGNIPVQLTLTTDNSETATQNTDVKAEISVVIPPQTNVKDNDGNNYAGAINPPRVVKADTTVHTNLRATDIVIEMGNPDQTINFDQDLVVTVRVEADEKPDIYYYNKTTGKYELAGKAGVKDGITYEPGGTVLGVEDTTYTIGLLLDHMSTYVASTESLLPAPPTSTPGGGGAVYTPSTSPGTTNLQGMVNSAGRFLTSVTAISADAVCELDISTDTIGLDKDLKPLTEVTILTVEQPPFLSKDWHIIGLAYDLGPDGASFDPAVTMTFKYSPAALPENTNAEDLVLAYYDEENSEWVKLDSTVDAVNNRITAEVTHFTAFAVLVLPKSADFYVSLLNISPNQVAPGKEVTISMVVANSGNSEESYTAVLKINDVKEAEESLIIAVGVSRNISFNVVRDKSGIYNVELNGLVGSFTVAPTSATTTPEPTQPPAAILTPSPATASTSATPATTPDAASTNNWSLVWWIAGGVIIAGLVIFFIVRRIFRLRQGN